MVMVCSVASALVVMHRVALRMGGSVALLVCGVARCGSETWRCSCVALLVCGVALRANYGALQSGSPRRSSSSP
jgi:hypothetical protein